MTRCDHTFIREFRDLRARARREGELTLLSGTALVGGVMVPWVFLFSVLGVTA